jgi:hypothetical protein
VADGLHLKPGYAGTRGRGVAFYAGVLRTDNRARREAWRCTHEHAVASSAVRCAEAELERRTQGTLAVLKLQHCDPCALYYAPGAAAIPGWGQFIDQGRCPRCLVPLKGVEAVLR